MSKDFQQRLRSLRSIERELAPDPAWVAKTRSLLVSTIEQAQPVQKGRMEAQKTLKAMWRLGPSQFVQWMRRPVFATLAVFIGLAGGSLMSVSAAEQSLPGDFFYGLKLATEQARLAWVSAKDEKLKLKTEFTGRRIDELKQVATDANVNNDRNERVVEVAEILKRDLNTMKRQLTEVSNESSAGKAADVAKLVDKKTSEVVNALQETKSQLSKESKEKVTEVQSIAADTGIKAVAVLAEKHQESNDIVSATDVAQALENHAKMIAGVTSSTVIQVSLSVAMSATGTASSLERNTTGTSLGMVSSTVLLILPTSTVAGSTSTIPSVSTSTAISWPDAVDQLKSATTQAFAVQKSKDSLEGTLTASTTSSTTTGVQGTGATTTSGLSNTTSTTSTTNTSSTNQVVPPKP